MSEISKLPGIDETSPVSALRNLFGEKPQPLLDKAKTLATGKKEIFASPCVIDGSCKTDPLCRHCKWRGMTGGNRAGLKKKSIEEAVMHAAQLEQNGADRVFLASGWMGYSIPDHYVDYVKAIRASVHIDIFGLFGAVNGSSLERLKAAGMDGYLCGIESPNEEVYRSFRPGGDTLASRIQTLFDSKYLGLKIWTGFLYGLGETEQDIIKALVLFKKLDIDSLSILPFVPFPNTEMQTWNPPNLYQWSRILAIAKIYLGDINLFTSFEAQNMVAFGRNAGANGYYFFPQIGAQTAGSRS